MMEWIMNNWYIIVAVIACVASGIMYVVKFTKLSKEEQIEQIRQWLVYAVTMAEQKYKGGVGAIKLRATYDAFISKFPQAAKMISFDQFKVLVDEALVQMKHLIETNKYIDELIKKE